MIPKVIHYCWFGNNPKSPLVEKCIKSWSDFCPGYEIIEWNESNVDLNMNPYVKKAYEDKKWAFLTDYLRLYIVYNHGGIYLDTDVQIIKNYDDLLDVPGFVGVEKDNTINTGLGFAAEKNNLAIKAMLDVYDTEIKDGNYIACPELNTKGILNHCGSYEIGSGYIDTKDIRIYAKDYFCPKDFDTKRISITNNTYSIHHFEASWLSKKVKFKKLVKSMILRLGSNQ